MFVTITSAGSGRPASYEFACLEGWLVTAVVIGCALNLEPLGWGKATLRVKIQECDLSRLVITYRTQNTVKPNKPDG